MRIRAVVFDLDGTLVDSAPDILHCLADAAARTGVGERPFTRALIGPPVSQMIRSWGAELAEEQLAAVESNFRRAYDSSDLSLTLPYPGVLECLSELRAAGCRLFVATNKPAIATTRIIDAQLKGYFDGHCCVDSNAGRRMSKHDMLTHLAQTFSLSADSSVMIGDGESDVAAAQALAWRTMAALYGYGDPAQLLAQQPTWAVANAGEIASILLRP